LLVAFLISFLTPILYAKDIKPVVIVTTTTIESIVSEVGKGSLEVISLIPPNSCPGHFDLRPSDAIRINSADLLLAHGFEKETFLKKVAGLRQKKSALRIVVITVEGSWMVPDIHLAAVDEITKILKEQFPRQAGNFELNASRYKKKIEEEAKRIRIQAYEIGFEKINAVASNMQKDLLIWFGIKVVAVYGREDEISALELQRLIEQARSYNVSIVVDNLQSAAEAGKPIADELGITHIVLSNFPGFYAGEVSYIGTLKENAQKLFSILKK
jgi:ABC-type Zn uptake system ZnuABC Zn-binding protein ZnuA